MKDEERTAQGCFFVRVSSFIVHRSSLTEELPSSASDAGVVSSFLKPRKRSERGSGRAARGCPRARCETTPRMCLMPETPPPITPAGEPPESYPPQTPG